MFIVNTNIRMLWPEFEAACFITQARSFSVGSEGGNEEIFTLLSSSIKIGHYNFLPFLNWKMELATL